MFFNLFTDYLLKNNKITDEEFKTIKIKQSQTRVKLGLIAVSEKMISTKQAEEINRKQAIMDKRFGDIAVELGYLNSDQVAKLLELQGNPYMLFCQTITDSGILSLSEVEECFQAFIDENGFDDNAAKAIKEDDIDNIIPLFLTDATGSMIEIISVAIRTMNRLISTDLSIMKGAKIDSYNYDYLASQSLEGDYNIMLAIAGDKAGSLELSSLFAAEEFTEINMDSLDSIGEFINIVNGLYATALSYRKIQVELLAPNYSEAAGVINSDNLYKVPLLINQKPFDMVVSYK